MTIFCARWVSIDQTIQYTKFQTKCIKMKVSNKAASNCRWFCVTLFRACWKLIEFNMHNKILSICVWRCDFGRRASDTKLIEFSRAFIPFIVHWCNQQCVFFVVVAIEQNKNYAFSSPCNTMVCVCVDIHCALAEIVGIELCCCIKMCHLKWWNPKCNYGLSSIMKTITVHYGCITMACVVRGCVIGNRQLLQMHVISIGSAACHTNKCNNNNNRKIDTIWYVLAIENPFLGKHW